MKIQPPGASVRSLALGCCVLQPWKALSLAPYTTAFVTHSQTNKALTSVHSYSTTTALAMSSTSSKEDSSKMDQSFPTWRFDTPCPTMEWNAPVEAEIKVGVFESFPEADLTIVGVMAPTKEESSEDEDGADEDKEVPPMELTGASKTLDEFLSGTITDVLAENAKAFKNGAKMGSLTPVVRVVGGDSGSKAKRYAIVGLGTTPKSDDDSAKDSYAEAGSSLGKAIANKCHAEKKVGAVTVVLPSVLASDATIMKDLATSFYQTLYADNRYRTGAKVKKPAEDLKSVTILSEGGEPVDASVIEAGKKLATGIFLTKDIVNAPHNVLNSLSLAETAKRIAEQSGGRITCEILDKEACEARCMGGFLGVARGSETPPQFIHLTYTPPSGKISKKVGVIGKGLLFDTGGYNIKTAMMELMKFDCGGAAAVLGAARAIGALQPEGVEAHFVVAACENMINEKAMVPSDILTASNGKTIEVMNTDAEGRLTLADALVFCDKEIGCESIIELSTLTGACMISLGKQICGVWTDNDELAKEIEDISKKTGDKSWRMPMAKEYNELLESKFADLKNIGTRYGGAITAALFLQNFVSKKKPFAHIDIAGPVWSDKDGATGFGAKLVTEWVTRQGQAKIE
jgi:leucyl aminopeptidase